MDDCRQADKCTYIGQALGIEECRHSDELDGELTDTQAGRQATDSHMAVMDG